jgi:hypothetical protein
MPPGAGVRFSSAFAQELHGHLSALQGALAKEFKGGDWPVGAKLAFQGLAMWWSQYKGLVGGPGDLLALISEAAGIGADWDFHQDQFTWFAFDTTAPGVILGRFDELEIRQVFQVQVPALAAQAQAVQIHAQEKAPRVKAATMDQVELGLAKLEEALGLDEVQGLSQAELIRGLGELGVSTTDRTLRETVWWRCRQDQRAVGKRRLSARRGRG